MCIRDRAETAAVSNVGQIKLPEVYAPYIRLFDVFTLSLIHISSSVSVTLWLPRITSCLPSSSSISFNCRDRVGSVSYTHLQPSCGHCFLRYQPH